MILALAIAAVILSSLPALMFLKNITLFSDIRSPGTEGDNEPDATPTPSVAVLIPARDEENSIAACVSAALASEGVDLQVVVLDDHSSDATAQIVREIASTDARVRLVEGTELPAGWNGKQFACRQLADQTDAQFACFVDADVRLHPQALRQLIARLRRDDLGLISAFPRQLTETWLEKWIIPMMHFILLGYLPFGRMRSDLSPSLAAGCGQLFLTSCEAYYAAGTHEAIKESRHDGIKLPRAYRSAGLKTDVVDGTELASCRMYQSGREVVRGVLKNADEGIANVRSIVPFTVLLLGASVLPLFMLVVGWVKNDPLVAMLAGSALIVSHIPRLVAAIRFRQSLFGACCHIPTTLLFVALQWVAFFLTLRGQRVAWRGRTA